MIDLHTHILPNIDDGAGDLEEALGMVDVLYQQSVSQAVCTPHFYPAQITLAKFIEVRRNSMKQMSSSKVTLLKGSETYLHEYLFHYPNLSELCIENTRYLLLELPYRDHWNHTVFDSIEHLIGYYNIIPIIAHIDRYKPAMKNQKIIKKLISIGCMIQLNTSCLSNKKTRRHAIRLLKKGYIDVLGSDCHNLTNRKPDFNIAYSIIKKKLGGTILEELNKNAESIINGKNIRRSYHTYVLSE